MQEIFRVKKDVCGKPKKMRKALKAESADDLCRLCILTVGLLFKFF